MTCCAVLLEGKFTDMSALFPKGAYLVTDKNKIIGLVDRYWSSVLISESECAFVFALKKANATPYSVFDLISLFLEITRVGTRSYPLISIVRLWVQNHRFCEKFDSVIKPQ